MIAVTLITSKTVISKGFRLRGQALEKVHGGSMYAGAAERLALADLADLGRLITGLDARQALTYGSVSVPGDKHQIVTAERQVDGQNISRTRTCFEFAEGQEGVLLLDYDPPKDGSPALSRADLVGTLQAVCPGLTECETLITASASSFIYKTDGTDGTEMLGQRGWHVFVRVANAADIPAIGENIDGRLWLAGFGRVELSSSGGKLLRGLIDTGVWQPERLSYDAGAACGAGLVQKRPAPVHARGRALTLADVGLADGDMDRVQALQDAARGITPHALKGRKARPLHGKKSIARAEVPEKPIQALTPRIAARVMEALLHIKLEVDKNTHISVGMGLKNSFGEAGFALWDAWSKPSTHYKGPQALRAVWVRFTRAGYTVKTVFYYAKQQGWDSKAKKIDLPLPVFALPESEHEPLAETVSVYKARAVTLQTLYHEIVKNEAPPAIQALRITTGVGKTTNLKKIFDDIKHAGKSITIVARGKKECEDYEAAGAFWRHGREATDAGFTPETPWHCPHAGGDGPVQKLAEAEHRLQQMCRGGHCAHGNKAMLNQARDSGQCASDTVIRFFKEKPEILDVPACAWFDHLGAGQRHKIRVVTAAGVSPADLKTQKGPVDFLIIDEGVEWSHSHMLDLPTVRSYIQSLASLKTHITKNDEHAPTDFLDSPVQIFRELAIQMGQHAATAAAGVYTKIGFDLSVLVDSLNAALDDHGAALWEKPQWAHWTELVRAPLRALSAIRDGLKAGSLSMRDGALHLTFLHSVIENALRAPKPIPIIILDATLDATAAAMTGDKITHVVSDPNLDWIVDPRWFMSAKKDVKSLATDSLRAFKTLVRQEAETGLKSFVISRKALALYMLSRLTGMPVDELLEMPTPDLWSLSIAHRVGWWGWHDVAHDFWNGLNGLLWGQMPVPDDVRIQQYMDHRAALMQIMPNAEPLPMASNEWESGQWIATGDHEQQSMARLPVQPEARAWLLERVSAQKVQAAGRSRATCQERRMTIWQVGGYPMTGLAEHGIRPVYTRLVDGLSGGEVAAFNAARRLDLMTSAASAIVAGGGVISRPAVRKMIGTISKPLNTNKSSGAEPVPSRYIYINQDGTGSGQQEVLHNNDLRDAGLRNADYDLWRSSANAQSLFAGRFDPRDSQATVAQLAAPVDRAAAPEQHTTPTEFQTSVLQRGLDYLGEAADASEGLPRMLQYLESEQYLAVSAAQSAEIADIRKQLAESVTEEVL